MDEKSLYADPGKVPLCLKFSNGSQVVLKVGGSLVVGSFLRSAFKKMAVSLRGLFLFSMVSYFYFLKKIHFIFYFLVYIYIFYHRHY